MEQVRERARPRGAGRVTVLGRKCIENYGIGEPTMEQVGQESPRLESPRWSNCLGEEGFLGRGRLEDEELRDSSPEQG